ncbi:hypothetical protein GCM10020367_14050 [Streptomyces sannanensis]|uniref:Uncharacterized protein n=1 Tax=Streptomyces sannanensis TaxID=285536 RepID=A0ABP6S7K4_9ACTN
MCRPSGLPNPHLRLASGSPQGVSAETKPCTGWGRVHRSIDLSGCLILNCSEMQQISLRRRPYERQTRRSDGPDNERGDVKDSWTGKTTGAAFAALTVE